MTLIRERRIKRNQAVFNGPGGGQNGRSITGRFLWTVFNLGLRHFVHYIQTPNDRTLPDVLSFIIIIYPAITLVDTHDTLGSDGDSDRKETRRSAEGRSAWGVGPTPFTARCFAGIHSNISQFFPEPNGSLKYREDQTEAIPTPPL